MRNKNLYLPEIIAACFVIAIVACVLLFVDGCASRNLTGRAKAHQQITLIIADDCTAANSAKAAYKANKLPQTDAVRSAINDAVAACEDAKSAFNLALGAENVYRAMLAAEVNACAPSQAVIPPANNDACQNAAKTAATAKASADGANTTLDAKLAKLQTATAALPKQ